MKKILLFTYLSILLCFNIKAQTYQFKVLSAENTNIYPYIYALTQDSLGFLWIGTGDGLFTYDGINIYSYPLTFITGGDNFVTSLAIRNDNTTFAGLNNGAIVFKKEQKFYLIKESLKFNSTINQLSFYNDELWIAVQNKGIYKLNKDNTFSDIVLLPNLQTYCFIKLNQYTLIGTSDGLYVYFNNQLSLIKNFPQSKIETIVYNPYSNTVFFSTEDEGLFEVKIKNKNFNIVNRYDFLQNIKDIIVDNEGNLYVATMGSGVYFLKRNVSNNSFTIDKQFTDENGLPSLNIKKLFIDKEKNLWIGSYGSGLFAYYENAFTFLLQKINDKDASFTALHAYNEYLYAATSTGKLLKININNFQNVIDLNFSFLTNQKISSLYIENNNFLWIGTEENGIFVYDIQKNKLIKHFYFNDKLLNNINYIDGYGKHTCVGTKNGLIIIEKENNQYKTDILTTINGLPHNYINHLLCELNGNVIIVTPTNFISRYNLESKTLSTEKINIQDMLKINSVTKDFKNHIWLATYGNGIFKYDSVLTNYTTTDGLFSDYAYSIIADETGTIWVGHRQGISSIKGNSIKTFSKNIGLLSDCNINAVTIDKNGSIWFGTTKGILHYNHKKNVINKVPPTVIVTSLKINDVEQVIKPYIELESGKYKIQLTFTGISFRESENVTFQYILEGYDANWSELTTNRTALYPRLDEGTYTFKVFAYNADKIRSSKPYIITIKILPPFYKRWWFILLSILTVLYSFYLILKIRERNHKRMEKILKEKLDQRTKEVIRQKELIERKNKDITDSIQYAKRIQEAILPSIKILNDNFPNSFVLYLPRDIVSGDFYVFQKLGERFIFICADATGHGVPGAFMSLISSIIIKDILHSNENILPSELLTKLDFQITQIFEAGNQETQDGLDLAVCIYNPQNQTLVYSAAMRPLLLFQNNQWVYIKGSRFSIGISKYIQEKTFIDNEIKLNKGDRFYLFTDGLPDQFNDNEKKLKVRGLIHWIEELQHLNMKDQQKEIYKRFITWKGDKPQIDDILLMGIEI